MGILKAAIILGAGGYALKKFNQFVHSPFPFAPIKPCPHLTNPTEPAKGKETARATVSTTASRGR